MRLRLPLLPLLALLLCASPLAAQDTAAVKAYVTRDTADLSVMARDKTAPLYSKQAQARMRARADSIRAALAAQSPTPTPTPTPVVVVDTTPTPAPTPAPSGTVTLAQLPLATVDVTMPTGYTIIDVPAGGSLQAAIDASGCRVNIRGAAGATYAPVTLRQKPCNEKYSTILSTNNGLPALARGVRVTPALAASRRQAKILTTGGNVAALLSNAGVHGYYVEDITIAATGTTALNAIVYLGTQQTTLAEVPGDFVFSHTYVTGTPTLEVKRCWYLNSASTAIVDSWGGECHSNQGDSQCILGLNGPGPYLVDNVYCEAGHEVIAFGGGDPTIPNLIPSDITIRRSHITRPIAWKGVWQEKNLIETKCARRMLIEGNVIENSYQDAQAGYWGLFKAVNQDGGSPWCTSQDITIRDNMVRNVGAGINLCAQCQGVSVAAARITISNNITLGLNCGVFTGEAREWQFLGGLSDIAITHNTTTGCGVQTAVSIASQPPKIARLIFASNILDYGQYGIHGEGTGGLTTLTTAVETSLAWSYNAFTGAGCSAVYSDRCAASSLIDATGKLVGAGLPSHDGAPIGADAARAYSLTQGVVVADPSRVFGAARRAVATPKQSGYRATSAADRKRNTNGAGPSFR